MILLAFVQVVLRNVFRTGIAWADPALRHLVLWIGMVGASLATRQEKHISVDAVTRFLPVTARVVLQMVFSLFSALLCLLLVRVAWTFVWEEKAVGSLFFGSLPLWPFQLILPLGFAFLSFRFVLRSMIHMLQWIQGVEG
jgi:TRAP-type C4-dicarboxylate transport system permease small subunit